jgi:hypothetical protein
MKKTNITLSIALATVFSASTAFAEAEVTGKIVYEAAKFTNTGHSIGDSGTFTTFGTGANGSVCNMLTAPNPATSGYCGVLANGGSKRTATGGLASFGEHGKDVFKSEAIARIFIDGEADEIADGATFHVELQGYTNTKATSNYDSNENYTQRDVLREAYVDMEQGDWSIRAGKQQVVWGTADGMKLLDMINPSDYGEMAQNQMEDSRIPVWMLNAETTAEDGTETQVVISQAKENVFVGLNRNVNTAVRSNNQFLDDATLNGGTDEGNPFMMKGPNTITGGYNGFLNIVPDMGSVATRFAMAFTPTSVTGGGVDYNGQLATIGNLNSAAMQGFTVDIFEGMTMAQMNGALAGASGGVCTADGTTNMNCIPAGFAGAIVNTFNNLDAQGFIGVGKPLGDIVATDLTGSQMLAYGFDPLYDSNLANVSVAQDTAFDYMGGTTFRTFDRFVNARSQYKYKMPKNSDIDLAIRTKKSLESGLNYSLNASYNYDKNPIINVSWRNDAGELLSNDADMFCPAIACGADTTTLGDLKDADGVVYGGSTGNSPILQFEQEVKRVMNFGGSFDTAIETAEFGPVVIRGEALYTKGSHSPIIDKTRLSIGDLPGALKMQKGDRAKFVLGVDITALTNMMVSAQFIQDSDLDFVDGTDKYTADYATMHLVNGFNKATKDKNFYSLFFSKPFGESGQHRWNNITMYEEGNGNWNRFDIDYSIDDDTQATFEYNKYWGSANTQFGQLKAASNMQVGVKYSF